MNKNKGQNSIRIKNPDFFILNARLSNRIDAGAILVDSSEYWAEVEKLAAIPMFIEVVTTSRRFD